MFFEESVDVIPLITCEEGEFRCNHAALEWLEAQECSQLRVCSIAGKYRTGKSFLMNRLMDAPPNSGFGVGNTINACTKGIWMYPKLFKNTEGEGLLFLDTEGIGALDATSEHDVRIFTMGLLLSSIFIYNSVGAIDESSIQSLSLMTKICQHVRVHANQEATESELAPHFPEFMWVLRDFSLRIESKEGVKLTQGEYLESALADPAGGSGGVRKAIRNFFASRSLTVMPRPTNKDSMETLERSPGAISAKFRESVQQMKERIMSTGKLLRVNDQHVTPRAFAAMCKHTASQMHGGGIPSLKDAWSMMADIQARDARDAALALFATRSVDTEATASQQTMLRQTEAWKAETLAAFDTRVRSLDSCCTDIRLQLSNELVERCDHIMHTNTQRVVLLVEQSVLRVGQDIEANLLQLHMYLSEAHARISAEHAGDAHCLAHWMSCVFEKLVSSWLPSFHMEVERKHTLSNANVQQLTASKEKLEGRHGGGGRVARKRTTAVQTDGRY